MPMAPTCRPSASFAPARLTLISDAQYVNIVRDVFGVTLTGDVTTVASTSGKYPLNEAALVDDATATAYLRAADRVAALLTPCGANAVTATCMQQFLRQKLPLAWRRPVTDAEIVGVPASNGQPAQLGLMDLFNAGLPDGTDRAVALVMEAALGSSSFLYRAEFGGDASAAQGAVALTPYELASALSFGLLDSVPDSELMARAADGTLVQPTVLSTQLDRLLALPAVQAHLQKKVSYYAGFEKIPFAVKDPTAFAEFSPTLRTALYDSAQGLLNDVVWKGTFPELFTTRRIYANQTMASVYGLPSVTGTQLAPVEPQGAGYNAGILTHPAFLAATNQHVASDDIVHRGLWIWSNLVCGNVLGAPPADATAVFSTLTGTEREKALKRDALSCGGCHRYFDPLGLVTENYDPIGRYRATSPEQPGVAIDTTATLVGLGAGIDGTVADATDVSQRLLGSRRAADCAAQVLSQYLMDHNPAVENSCELQKLKDGFSKDGSFTGLFKGLFTSPAFLTRDEGP